MVSEVLGIVGVPVEFVFLGLCVRVCPLPALEPFGLG